MDEAKDKSTSKCPSPTPSADDDHNDLSNRSSEDTIWDDASANTSTPEEVEVVASDIDKSEAILPKRSYSRWCPVQQGATLVWRDVCVYATDDRKKKLGELKRIINNSTGAIQPGTLMALMGSR